MGGAQYVKIIKYSVFELLLGFLSVVRIHRGVESNILCRILFAVGSRELKWDSRVPRICLCSMFSLPRDFVLCSGLLKRLSSSLKGLGLSVSFIVF